MGGQNSTAAADAQSWAAVDPLLAAMACLLAFSLLVAVPWDLINKFSPEVPKAKRRRTSLSSKLRLALEDGEPLQTALEGYQLGASIFICFSYVQKTYMGDYYCSAQCVYCQVLAVIEIVLGVLCCIDFCVRMLAARKKIKFVFSARGIIDIATIPSLVFSYYLTCTFITFCYLRAARLYLSLKAVLKSVEVSDVLKSVINLVVLIVASVFCFAGTVFATENLGNPPFIQEDDEMVMTFFTSVYFILVTISTVGYGDYNPSTTFSRVVVIGFILTGVTFFGVGVSELFSNIQGMRMGRGTYARRSKKHKHVVVIGVIDFDEIQSFLREFFHEDHGTQDADVVFLVPLDPPEQLNSWLRQNPRIQSQVTYLKGSAMVATDIARAKIADAGSIFVMPEKSSIDTLAEDAGNTMRLLSAARANANADIYALAMESESVEHFLTAGVASHRLVCVESMKMSILGKSCEVMGFSTFISNLFLSINSAVLEAKEMWLDEYLKGASQEIYVVDLPGEFDGKSYCEVVYGVYDSYGSIVLGLFHQKNSSTLLKPRSDYLVTNEYQVIVIDDDCQLGVKTSKKGDKERERPRRLKEQKSAKFGKSAVHPKAILAVGKKKMMDGPLPALKSAPQIAKTSVERGPSDSPPVPQPHHLRGHILVCGSPTSLVHFIKPLRVSEDGMGKKKDVSSVPVVILAEDCSYGGVSPERFPNVYHLRGNPNIKRDLMQAGLLDARRIVVVSPPAGHSTETESRLADASPIFTTLLAQNLAPKVRVIAEITNPQNIGFLPRRLSGRTGAPDSTEGDDEFYFTPQYASGGVYSASSLDALLIQSFYNPDIIPVINLLISGLESADGLSEGVQDTPVTVSQILVPKEFVGKEYGKLLEKLIFDKEMVAVGLYRFGIVKGEVLAPQPYVFTNPPKDTLLSEDDRVFVLRDR
uniref:RCK N-terminal domain-containing protein n=1 Tax=Palpitomonas bilix TaxID=652834 RepID=A0A7S3CZV1_9EUKA|mmetsp:Transcript_16266/g.41217  ORF Transcript_16266/g.41217 Transcript_16266/m.41217 type:complete len:928 (+) Transcript_16266:149-2932(+)